jgi:hypothetical protein
MTDNITYIQFIEDSVLDCIRRFEKWLATPLLSHDILRTNEHYFADMVLHYDSELGYVITVYYSKEK